MLRQHAGVHIGQERSIGSQQGHLNSVVINLLQAGNGVRFASLVFLGAHNGHHPALIAAGVGRSRQGSQGKDHVIGVEILTIVPLHILTQVEGVDRTVFADVPALGQVAHIVQLLVRGDQEAEDQALSIAVGGSGLNHGIQVGNLRGLRQNNAGILGSSPRRAGDCFRCVAASAAPTEADGQQRNDCQQKRNRLFTLFHFFVLHFLLNHREQSPTGTESLSRSPEMACFIGIIIFK